MAQYKSLNTRRNVGGFNAGRGGRFGNRGRFSQGRGGFRGGYKPNNKPSFYESKKGEHFLGLSAEQVKEFSDIRNNKAYTKAELKKAEEEFIGKTDQQVQEKYTAFIEKINKKKASEEDNKKKKYETLSDDAKKIFDQIENMKKNEDISYTDEKSHIRELLNAVPKEVREELKFVKDNGKRFNNNKNFKSGERSKKNNNDIAAKQKSLPFLEGLTEDQCKEYLSIRKDNIALPKKEVAALEAAWSEKQTDDVKKAFKDHVEAVEKKLAARFTSDEANIAKITKQLNEYASKLHSLKLNSDISYEKELKQIKEVHFETIKTLRSTISDIFPYFRM